jgi:hypothetical protein
MYVQAKLFGGDQEQGEASKPLEVGDSSRWAINCGSAVFGFFPDNGGGFSGGKTGARQAIREATHS